MLDTAYKAVLSCDITLEKKEKVHVTISDMFLMPLRSGLSSTGWTQAVMPKGHAAFLRLLWLDGVKLL